MALYAEMYGVPLTAYFVMTWFGRTQADAENHFNGHLWPIVLSIPDAYLRQTQVWFTLVGQLLILLGGLLAVLGCEKFIALWRRIRWPNRGFIVSSAIRSIRGSICSSLAV